MVVVVVDNWSFCILLGCSVSCRVLVLPVLLLFRMWVVDDLRGWSKTLIGGPGNALILLLGLDLVYVDVAAWCDNFLTQPSLLNRIRWTRRLLWDKPWRRSVEKVIFTGLKSIWRLHMLLLVLNQSLIGQIDFTAQVLVSVRWAHELMSQERVGRAFHKQLFIVTLSLRFHQRILTRDERCGELAIWLGHLVGVVKLLSQHLLSCYRIFVLEVLCMIITWLNMAAFMKLVMINFIAAIMILLHRCLRMLVLIHVKYIIFLSTLHHFLFTFWLAT